jgi:hypothetical protein
MEWKMGKVNFMLDEDVRQELNALVPPGSEAAW